jgi:hypothetical protein
LYGEKFPSIRDIFPTSVLIGWVEGFLTSKSSCQKLLSIEEVKVIIVRILCHPSGYSIQTAIIEKQLMIRAIPVSFNFLL